MDIEMNYNVISKEQEKNPDNSQLLVKDNKNTWFD